MNYQEAYEILKEYIPWFYPPNSHRIVPRSVYEKLVVLLDKTDHLYGFYFQGPLGSILICPDRNVEKEL